MKNTYFLILFFLFISNKTFAGDEFFISKSWKYLYCGSKFNSFSGEVDNSSPIFKACMDVKNQEIKIIDTSTLIIKAQSSIIKNGKNTKTLSKLHKAILAKNNACKERENKKLTVNNLKAKSGLLWFGNYICIQDCSGHEAGYKWAEENHSKNKDVDCEKRGDSFLQGCYVYVEENEESAFLKEYCSIDYTNVMEVNNDF